jgi:predicted MFS family arabinose efflux permease
MMASVTVLGVLTVLDMTNPWLLLALTFALGLGAALSGPTWEAIVPELVPRSAIPAGVALNGVTINLARALGPALAGGLVASIGPGPVFLLNAATFLLTLGILVRWQRPPRDSVLPTERLLAAVRTGLRYTRYAPALNAVLVRTAAFIIGGSALWALLPLIARREVGLDAGGYGVLLGALGVGAVVGTALLPRVRQRVPIDWQCAGATVAFAAVTVALAFVREFGVLCAVMFVGGVAWIAIVSSLNGAAQLVAPAWVQGRARAVYLLVFQGGMAVGSVIWGAAAERVGIPLALVGAGAVLVIGLVTMIRWPLAAGQGLNLEPAGQWPDPIVLVEPEHEQGPVLVTIEYRVAPEQLGELASAMQPVSSRPRIRLTREWCRGSSPGSC